MLSLLTFSAELGLNASAEDMRMYMHGMDMIQTSNGPLLIFSSNNYPPTRPSGDWVHNVYSSWVNPASPESSTVNLLYTAANRSAQEPASAAINSNGIILVTTEDAQYTDELDQTYGLFYSDLSVKVPYGRRLGAGTNGQGGHSGHVAAVGDKFLVTFCEEWVNGGGVDNLGTGGSIYARIVDEDGNAGPLLLVSGDAWNLPNNQRKRDWWSVVAGSDENWLQVWQRYQNGTTEFGGKVYGRITNLDGSMGPEFLIIEDNKYYYHDVRWIQEIERYLVVGGAAEGGYAALVDKQGNVAHVATALPWTVREAMTVIKENGNGSATAVYPVEGGGAAVLNVTANSVTVVKNKLQGGGLVWDYMGTAGMFIDGTHVLFASGTTAGVKYETYDINALDVGGISDPNLKAFDAKLKDPGASPVIAFIGDGVTAAQAGITTYADYVTQMFQTINSNTTSYVAASAGNTAATALANVGGVLAASPDLTFIMLGYEDAKAGVGASAFTNDYTSLIETLTSAGSAVIILTPYDVESRPANYVSIINATKTLADALLIPMSDLHRQWDLLRNSSRKDVFDRMLTGGTTPNQEGHDFMFQNLRSSLISLLVMNPAPWGDHIKISYGMPPEEFYDRYDNVALGKPAWATQTADDDDGEHFDPNYVTDGDYSTRWDSVNGSGFITPQYLWIDLGDVYQIYGITIDWDAVATRYDIQFSMDGQNWTQVYTTTAGGRQGDFEAVEISGAARWVRFVGNRRENNAWGISIIEFGVFGEPAFKNSGFTDWYDNKSAAYAVGFIGGGINSAIIGERIMREQGFRGTLYVDAAQVGNSNRPTWASINSVVANGTFDLGYFGPQLTNSSGAWVSGMNLTNATTRIQTAKNLIVTNTGRAPEVMRAEDYYSNFNDSLYNLMSQHFLGTSAGDFGRAIDPPRVSSPLDYYKMGAAVFYHNASDWGVDFWNTSHLNEGVDDAIVAGGFFAPEFMEFSGTYGGVTSNGSGTGRYYLGWGYTPHTVLIDHLTYVNTRRDELFIESRANIIKFMRERDAATAVPVGTSAKGGVLMRLSLPQDMAGELDAAGKLRYDMPVTVKTNVPVEWLKVGVQQGSGAELEVASTYENGARWVVYNALPGDDLIALWPAELGYEEPPVGRIQAEVSLGEIMLEDDNATVPSGSYFEIKLLNCSFADLLTTASVRVNNLPAGLSYTVSRVSDDTIRINISGKMTTPNSATSNVVVYILKGAILELGAIDSGALSCKITGGLRTVGESDIAVWKDNKVAAYSATYDDGIIRSLNKLLPLHQQYNIPAELAIAPHFIDVGHHPDDGWMGMSVSIASWSDLRSLVATGLFYPSSHMLNHCMKGTYPNWQGRDMMDMLAEEGSAALRADFAESKARLELELGVPVESIIYPHYDTTAQISAWAGEIYLAGRTGDTGPGVYNKATKTNTFNVVGTYDFALVCKDFLDGNVAANRDTTVAEARGWLDDVILNGQWLITTGHGVDYEGWGSPPLTVYAGFLEYLDEMRELVWVDTMTNVTKYRAERAAAVLTSAYDNGAVSVSLTTPSLENATNGNYNQALTIRTRVPDDWDSVYIKQGNDVLDATFVKSANGTYAIYNAVPGAGAITLLETEAVAPVITPALAAVTVRRGQSVQLVVDTNCQALIYTSAVPMFATVSPTGVVTGLMPGITVIRITDPESGLTANVAINVVA